MPDDTGVTLSLPVKRDRDAEALVTQVTATGQPSLRERGVAGARTYLEERAAAAPPGPEMAFVHDDIVPTGQGSVAVRVYRAGPTTGAPVIVYFHGGGWVIGSIAASDAFCRRLAHAAACVVVSVDYPLAPEHPFPAAADCAVVAIEWAAGRAEAWGGDPARLIAMGDSAGGNLATVAVRRLVAAGKEVVARQILAYPGVTADRPVSGTRFGGEWPLTDGDRLWFVDQYVPNHATRGNPDVAPLLADVSGMPPTTLLLGGCDPLVEEGLAYAARLWREGVSVDLHLFSGQFHGFLTLDETVLPHAREGLGLVANAITHT